MSYNGGRLPTIDILGEVPRSAGQLWVYCEQGRKLEVAQADLLEWTAAELRAALRRVPGDSGWMLGLDAKAKARRVTRHLVKAAGHHIAAANELRSCYREFHQLYVVAKQAARRGQFVVHDQRRAAPGTGR